ncbi:MAG: ATP-binding protein [Fusobacteriaceae bacterium]|jgi:DNA replication protein DnaC|nr:ATP-binding protein [Fusobacteriaceae bacterium]
MEDLKKCPYCGKAYKINDYDVSFLSDEIKNRVRFIPDCTCAAERAEAERAAEIAQKRRADRLAAVMKYERMSIENLRFDGASVYQTSEKEQELHREIAEYAENFDDYLVSGTGFIFMGFSGSGKTYCANIIAERLRKDLHTVLILTMGEYLLRVRQLINGSPGSEQELLDHMLRCELLILDDLGSEVFTDWAKGKLFEIIDGRYRAKMPTIITTNLTLKMLAEKTRIDGSDKIFDRLKETCRVRIFGWPSHRKACGS